MYIGNDLQIAHPSYKIIDDISSSFNGSTTSFALQVSGATPVPFPISTQQVMISVNGVVQEPDPSGSAGFKLLGSNIVFSSAPANGHAFFGVINAGADYVTAGSEFPDGSATAPSFTFQDDQDTGWFRNASGDVGYSSNGAAILNFDGNGLTIAAGKGLTVDTSTLKVDAANNRVGIGVASPLKALHVKSTGAVLRLETTATTGSNYIDFNDADENKAFIGLGSGGDDSLSVWNVKNDTVRIATNNTERMRIDSGGRLMLSTIVTTNISNNADDIVIGDLNTSNETGITISSTAGSSIRFNDNAGYAGGLEYSHSDDTLRFSSNAAERIRIDSSGRLLIGSTANNPIWGVSAALQVEGTTGNTSAINLIRNSNDGSAPYFTFGKSRGTSDGSSTVVQSGDGLGHITWTAADGTDMNSSAASIAAAIDGTPGSNDVPGRLVFSTTADGASGTTERMRLDSAGRLLLGTTSLGDTGADDLTIATAGGTGITLRSGSSSTGQIYFSDGTSGADQYRGYVQYSHSSNALKFGTNAVEALVLDSSQNATFAGLVSDSKGDLRKIPKKTESGSGDYTLVVADAEKAIKRLNGKVIVPSAIFAGGDVVTIVNASGSDIAVDQGSSLTLYNSADAATGNRTLAARGMATIWFETNAIAYISGSGLS